MRITVDANRPLADEPSSGHNRWHPGIQPIATIAPGQVVTLETREGADGQLTPASTTADVLRLELGRSHPLTGPIFVEGAQPGDVLEVEIISYEAGGFGTTAIYPGFGFLADLYPDPFLAKWSIANGMARSAEIPGVTMPAEIFAGVMGVAPSAELMDEQRLRERVLAEDGFEVAPSDPERAVPMSAADGLRTIPPRENGGNLDVRHLIAGSRLLLPVFVPGALFSAGDLHFVQGDGEVCGTGIEMAGAVTVRFSLIEQPVSRRRFPSYEVPSRVTPPSFVTTGISLADDGTAGWMDIRLAARRALVELIEHLCVERDLSREAAYALTSLAGNLTLSQVVDVPYPLVSASIRTDIFDL